MIREHTTNGVIGVSWHKEDDTHYVNLFLGDNEISMDIEEAKALVANIINALNGIHNNME